MLKLFGRHEYPGNIQWIAPAGSETVKGCVFRARRKVHSDELAPNRTIHIAAESYYVLYMNGKQIGSGPARGTENCNFLDTYDIAEYTVKDENIIAVEVFCNNVPTFTASPAQPALFVASGSVVCDHSWQVQLAGEYRTQDVPNYTPQTGLMEWRDLRKSPQGWQTFSDDTEWSSAQIIDPGRKIYSKKIFLREIPYLLRTEVGPVEIPVIKTVGRLDDINNPDVAAVLEKEKRYDMNLEMSALVNGQPHDILPVSDDGGVAVVVDFGCEFVGHFQLDIDAPGGTIVDTGYQEVIAGDRLNLCVAEYRFADRYILAQGRQILSNPLRWRGGRYMQLVLRNFHRPITIHSLKVIDVRYPVPNPAEFSCDNEFYTELWNRSLVTLRTCAADTIMDCPWREMAFWVNDFLVVNRYWLQMTGQGDLSRRCLSLALSQRRADGLIPGVCPYDGNPNVVLFATNLFLPLILRDYLAYTGDRNDVREILDEIGDVVEACGKFSDSQGLLIPPQEYWNFVDWSFELNGITLKGRNSCVVNWFHVLALDALGDIYQSIDATKAADYRKRARRIAEQIRKAFWNRQQGCFVEYLTKGQDDQPPLAGKLAHALALLSGRVSDDIKGQVEQAIFRDDLLSPELYMTHFLFEAMIKLKKPEEVERLIEKYWRPILDSGCPTVWEMGVHQQGKAAMNNYASLCHAFSLAPVNYLQRYVLGLAPAKDGFPLFSFSPHIGNLSEMKGSVHTALGRISVECRRKNGAIEANLEIPSGITIELSDGRRLKAGKQKIIV